MKYPAVLILGRTNVGKSTLFNRLAGGKFAITHPTEHTTRDLKIELVKWNEKIFELIDSGGFDLHEKTDLTAAVIQQIQKAMAESTAIIFVIDGQTGWHQAETQIFNQIQNQHKPTVIAVNKMDSPDLRKNPNLYKKFQRSGLVPILVSAKNGGGTGDLLDAVTVLLKKPSEIETTQRSLKVAIIGKTNVGKSALTNALLGEEIRVVSSLPHTTRDSAEYVINYQNQSITLIDTAGVRTRGRTADQIEALSLKATLAALEKADLAMLVWRVDDKIGLVEKTLASKAVEMRKGLLLVGNQIDLIKLRDNQILKAMEREIWRTLSFVEWAPIIFASATRKVSLEPILKTLLKIQQEKNHQIESSDLDKVCREVVQSLNLNFILKKKLHAELKQLPGLIPTFELHINLRTALPKAVGNIVEKILRKNFGFRGTPINSKLVQPYAKTI